MEKLLHYVWKHKLFPLKPLFTTEGEPVEVIDSGVYNTDSGPDFFNAKVRIGSTVWVGNVEIHEKSSDWFVHGHDKDISYNNVVLHVTGQADTNVITLAGKQPPQLVLNVPESVSRNYAELLASDAYPPCHEVISTLSKLIIHSFLSRLTSERLERKRTEVMQRLSDCNGSWEQVLFMTMARSMGFGLNSDAFEAWGRCVPLNYAAHIRDSEMQTEALFMGQAGFLDPENLPISQRETAKDDDYFQLLSREYKFLAHKFNLQPMPKGLWRFLRLRPQNFPYIRVSQMTRLYCSGKCNLSKLLESKDVATIQDILRCKTTDYWDTHYAFGREAKHTSKTISTATANSMIINAVVPVFSAYASYRRDEKLNMRAVQLLDTLPAEQNSVVTAWNNCGLTVKTAADSQALIQLKTCYCDRKDCLRCKIGFEKLRIKNAKQ